MDAFARQALEKFISEYSEENLGHLDDIIIEYLVSVLQSLGNNPNDIETDFDVEEFTYQMAAYIQGFEVINSTIVSEWLFSLAKRIELGLELNLEVVPIIKEGLNFSEQPNVLYSSSVTKDLSQQTSLQTEGKVHAPGTSVNSQVASSSYQISNACSTDRKTFLRTNTGNTQASALPLDLNNEKVNNFPKLFDDDTVSINNNNTHPVVGMFDVNFHLSNLNVNTSPYTCLQNEDRNVDNETDDYEYGVSDEEELEETASQTQYKYCKQEKVKKLMELFLDIPESQLRQCLSRARGNLEKAVKMILGAKSNNEQPSERIKEIPLAKEEQCVLDHVFENKVLQLKDIFSLISEERLRDRLRNAGGSIDRATQVILSEEENRKILLPDLKKFSAHKVSSKKTELTKEEKRKLKKDTLLKYQYVEEKEVGFSAPVVLVKEEENGKLVSLNPDTPKKSSQSSEPPSAESPVHNTDKKQRINPKFSKKTRFK